jgi:hypothetical protein
MPVFVYIIRIHEMVYPEDVDVATIITMEIVDATDRKMCIPRRINLALHACKNNNKYTKF